ncbi:NFX1-type zinc finger-containing protein 1 [Patella vulgata]|uniref:NFX1-type zinc finger-containing protein 1 n=1 Tax=Patella vulgata TaxID=6465 RepID=UPI0024A97536|nr:NFX1-type zinc finger-containing protein 1 [Patella vulgata]
MELLYRLEFDVTELGDIDWDTSKRLTYGSLVCLSSNYFQTFYNATVINRDQQLIKEGKIDVRFEHDLDDLFAMDGDKPFVMVENRAFYEAYRHVLGGLQNVKILPFEKYIVHCQNHVDPPIYIRQGRGRVFDLRPLIDDDIVLQKTCSFSRKSGCAAAVNVLDPHAWPPPELLNLNESQFRALQTALTKEFCMIQGPPGTGKTRVGLRIVKALLHNSKNWEAPGVPTRPMLIICYTNHALDQFLAGIAGFYDGQIVRVGNRITNEKLEKYSLKAWKDRGRKEGRYKNLGRESYNHGRNTEYYQNIIERASHNVDPEGDDIICEDNLYQIMLPRHRTQLQQAYCSGDSVIMEWLGLSKVTENKDNDFRLSRKQKKTSRQQRKSNIRMAEEDVNDVDNIFAIDTKSRWQLYRYWVSKARTKVRQNVTHQCKEYLESCTAQKGVMLMKEKLILSEASVIAMTTTGAAKYQHILQEINPRIIVIEEAAEVLEGHVIAALSEQCEHLILIGDHKQLRPNPNVHRLAKEFNLEISLFERMVDNGVHCDCLELQHRMRPEISKLLKSIYPKLVDHQSVCGRQDVKGMANNVFFINHYNKEDHDAETKSRSNVYEARFLVGLTDYLLKQGYGTHEITILATYSSQKQQLGRLMSDDQFKGITVTSVDNYQGEENEIVILSLVRNNKERDVGFLKTDNRVCVALSRAKKGLYVMGNFDILRHKSPLWNEIITTLERHGEIGQTLVLKCPNHPKGKGIKINTPDDFDKAASGGCQKICKSRLDCGHACELQCHLIDLEHRDYTCRKPCPKTCEEGHRCHLMCFQGCKKCQVSVSKFISRCGHYDQVPCHRPPAQHKCRFPCEKMLSCGHQCGNLCGFDHKCNICYV